MKRVFEYWAKVYRPGYEIFGARPDVFSAFPTYGTYKGEVVKTADGEPLKPIEPMLSLRGGFRFSLEYEADYLAINDYPALFLWFAQLDKTPLIIERFANSFGFLGEKELENIIALPTFQENFVAQDRRNSAGERARPNNIEKRMNQELSVKEPYVCWAEPLSHWYSAIEEMREAIHLWDKAKAGSKDANKKLGTQINIKLEKVTPTVYLDTAESSLELIVTPKNLLSALWLQLALAVDGRKAYKQCENEACRSWFEVGKWGSRVDKKYCRNSCKQAVYDVKKSKKLEPGATNPPSI